MMNGAMGKLVGLASMLTAAFVLTPYVVAADADSKAGNPTRGAQAWANNCARCHNMREPTEFRDDQWQPIVQHMRIRAGLTGQQARDILAFLQSSNYRPKTNEEEQDSSIPKGTEQSGQKVAMEAEAAALSGKQVYAQTCIACHGQTVQAHFRAYRIFVSGWTANPMMSF